MSSLDAAQAICEKLQAAGIRATTDPGAVNPPCVLIPPPQRTYDQNCGYLAQWNLHAIAPAPTGGDRTSWAALDALVDTIAGIYPLSNADPGAYVLPGSAGGAVASFPSYTVRFSEVIE